MSTAITDPFNIPTVQLYSSIEDPFAYLAAYRLRQIWPDYLDRLKIFWRALPLEYINHACTPQPQFEADRLLFAQIEPALHFISWQKEQWCWPNTLWPAFEALACAQAQGSVAAMEYSWALRYAHFAEGRCISLRHELMAIAEEVAGQGYLYYPRFQIEWDTGKYKRTIIAESWMGWRDLKLPKGATFILPNGNRITNPAIGEIDFDVQTGSTPNYIPFTGDPLNVYRAILDQALQN